MTRHLSDVLSLALLGFFFFTQNWTGIGLTTLLFSTWFLFQSLGNLVHSVCAIILVVVSLQYIVAPAIWYTYFQGGEIANRFHYNHAIGAFQYYEVIVPVFVALRLGLKTIHEPGTTVTQFRFDRRYVLKSIALSLILPTLNVVAPPLIVGLHLEFLCVISEYLLVSNILLFSLLDQTSLKIPAQVLFFIVVIAKATSGMFGDSLFWVTIYALLSSNRGHSLTRGFTQKVVLGICGLFLLIVLQETKKEYRLETSRGKSGLMVLLTASNQGFQTTIESLEDSSFWFHIVNRFNQGRIFSHVIASKRADPNIAGPSRLSTVALAAIIPRFAWPNKPKAGGKVNIENFTEIELNENTSMNIGWVSDFLLALGFSFLPIAVFLYFRGFYLLLSSFCSYCQFSTRAGVFLSVFVFGILSQETDLTAHITHVTKTALVLLFWPRDKSVKRTS